MDKKRLAIVMVLSLAVVLGWTYLNNLLRQQHPEWFQHPEPPAPAAPVATQTDPVDATVAPATTQPSIAAPQVAPAAATGIEVVGGEAEPTQLGYATFDPTASLKYPLAITIDPNGAAIQSATLNRFRRDVGINEPYVFQTPYPDIAADVGRSLATRYVVFNGQRFDLWNVPWVRQTPPATQASTNEAVTYTVQLRDRATGQPVLAIDKHFRLLPTSHPSHGYEFVLTYAVRNLSSLPAKVELAFNGPNLPAPENLRDIPEIVAGYNDDGQIALVHEAASGIEPDEPPQTLQHDDDYPMVWAGVLNAYFDAILLPELQAGKAVWVDQVQATAPRAPTDAGQAFTVLTFETPELALAPGQQVAMPFNVYLGPRQRAILNQPYYDAFPRDYDQTLVLTSGPCGFCTFQPLINLLVWLLSFFFMIFRDWGLAIIGLVLVVRLLLHPITKRSQIAMSRMSKMGPEIERLKKKYGDNKEELNKAMMSVYREQGITPILGCLPMLLQMPIWIALWSALQSTFELRHAPFLWGYTWIDDLAQPDRLIPFPEPIKLLFFQVDAINLLPVILGVVFFIQMKMQPKPANMTPEQAQQQKMMQWMSLLFPLLLYSGPSGLNLYIATSTAIGIWESKRVRDHIKAQEEAEKRGVVVSEDRDDREGRDRGGRGPAAVPRGPKKPEPPKGGLAGWIANLQAKAQEVQRDMEKKRRRDSR